MIITGSSANQNEAKAVKVYQNKVYFGGIFEDQVNIGFNSALGINHNDIFIGKTSLAGFTEWIFPIAGTAIDNISHLDVVGDEIMISGQYSDTLFVGTDTLVNEYQNATFIAYFDTSGNFLRTWEPDVFNADIKDFAYDSDGNLMMTGEFYQHFTYGGFSMTMNSGLNFFLLKYSPTLDSVLWGVYSQGNANYGISLAIDQDDNTYTTGAYNDGTFFIDTLINTGNSNHNMFISKIDTDGNQLWITTLEGTGEVHGYAVDCDDSSNVFAVGEFEGVMDAQGTVLTSNGLFDGVILKYNSNGDLQWAEGLGGTDTDEAYDVLLDDNLDPIVLLEAGVDPLYQSQTLYTHGFNEPLLVKLKNSDGSLVWDQRLYATQTSGVVNANVISRENDFIAIAGINRTGIEFNMVPYSAPNNKDFYVAVLEDSLTYHLSLEEQEEQEEFEEVLLYPNPVLDQVYISSQKPFDFLEIFDMRGNPVLSKSVNTTKLAVTMSDFTPGLYLIRMKFGDEFKTHKVLKIK